VGSKVAPKVDNTFFELIRILAQISERAFHSDTHCGATGLGGPPGYNSDAWQIRMMTAGKYYRILFGEQIVGGFIVRVMG
jgi:hypothetical protein